MEGKSMQWFSWSLKLQFTRIIENKPQCFFPCNEWTFGMVCKYVKHFYLHNCQPNVSQNHWNHHNCGNCWCLLLEKTNCRLCLLLEQTSTIATTILEPSNNAMKHVNSIL
jgi:hypothetical protein